MAKPVPGHKVDVPIVSFRITTDDKTLLGPAGVHSDQARTFGYNDFSYFERPEHYIRYIEPIESELAVQVEYDMDEQDQEWLDAVNAERRKESVGAVSYEVFEILIDKLEKEWFNLIKRIPQPQSHLPVEDSKCAICDDGEGENSNAIVFCDGCNLAVHQDCYGVPYIPEGQWLCRKCTVSPENPVSCLFCPNEGGAFKQTTTGLWSHLLCAIWIPELGVGNAIYMEPVEGVENVPKSRWKLLCSLCKERVGACIQCEKPSCFTAFHVTCARSAGLLMSMKLMGADGQLKGFCDKHLPADWRLASEADDMDDDSWHDSDEDSDEAPSPWKRRRKESITAVARPTTTTITTKSARAHAKSYRPGPPIVPRMIVNRLLDYVSKVQIGKRQLFIERLCRYWSLKREARRGAPLLKRLHLEPWTATTESRDETEAEKAKKLEFLVTLRNDLEKVRLLAELVRKREKEKLRQAQVIKGIVENFIFTHYVTIRSVYARIAVMDKEEIFVHPVDRDEVPDYYEVVKEPICFSEIDEKIENVQYRSVEEFKHDINLVFANAQLYNKSDTPFYRRAGRIKAAAEPILAELDAIPSQSVLLPPPEEGEEWVEPPEDAVGNLETSLVRLRTLLAPDPTEPSRDFLASIFVSEVAKPRSPSPPRDKKKGRNRDSERERERKRNSAVDRNKRFAEQEERYRERLALGGGRLSRRGGAISSPIASPIASPAQAPAPALAEAFPNEAPSDPAVALSDPVPGSSATGTPRRSRRGRRTALEEEAESDVPSAASSPGSIKPMVKPQRGVIGVQSVKIMTDAQRRAKERRLDLVTTSLDAKHQNERFNVGWILPEGSKRRRADPTPPAQSRLPDRKGKGRARNSSMSSAGAGSRSGSKRKAQSTEPDKEDGGEEENEGREVKRQKTSDDDLTPVPESAPQTATKEAFPHHRSSLSPLPEDMETPKSRPAELATEDVEMVDVQGGEEVEEAETKGGEAVKVGESVDEPVSAAVDVAAPAEESTDKVADKPESTGSGEALSAPTDAEQQPTDEPSKPDNITPAAANPAAPPSEAPEPPQASVAGSSTSKASKRSSVAPKTSPAPPSTPGPSSPQTQASETSKASTSKPKSTPSKPKTSFRPGMQVWAKVTSFPYFPAVIVDHIKDWETVPQTVLNLEEGESKNGPVRLVRFYGRTATYGWVGDDKLVLIGGEEDEVYLAGKEPRAKKSKTKSLSKRQKENIKAAYDEAMAARAAS